LALLTNVEHLLGLWKNCWKSFGAVEKAVEKASGVLKKLMKTRWVTVEPALSPLKRRLKILWVC
jgi:hypothetical protein